MSIQSEITRINTNIANAYDAVDTMGGTLPVTQNSANLPDAIATLAQTDYIQLEWIEGTGTQYIDTGITPDDNYIIEMTASNHSNDDTAFFGANTTWTTSSLLCYGVLDRIYFAGRDNDYISHNPTSATPYKITVSSSTFSVDNTSISMSTLGAINTTLKFFSGGSRIGKFKLYSAKVWNGNTLVGDYTPVIKKSNGEAGLYDKVSKTFFGNSGTGKFNTNNHDGYIQLEWIESTGSQYINTGINANTIGKIQTKFKSVNANNSTWRSVLYCEDPGGSYPGLGIRINDSNKLQFNYCSAYIPISTAVTPDSSEAANTWYDTELNGLNNIVTINNTVYNNTFSGSLPDGNIYVFATEYESAASQYSSMRISYLKIYNLSNELVRDFIPVLRTTDYEVGLYDKVNNQFYGNLGLGYFRPGIKIAGYNIVDNIQSSGSAYFDTGVSGGNKMEYALYLNTMGSKARNYEQYFAGDNAPASHKLYLNGTSNTSPVFAQQTNGNNWSGTSSSSLTLYNNASAKHTISFYSDGKLYLDTTLKGTGVNNG